MKINNKKLWAAAEQTLYAIIFAWDLSLALFGITHPWMVTYWLPYVLFAGSVLIFGCLVEAIIRGCKQ